MSFSSSFQGLFASVIRPTHIILCLLMLSTQSLADNFLGLAEYEEIKSPVYLASLSLKTKPKNPAHIHSMQGRKQMRFHIQKAGYPLRSFIRHLNTWAVKGNKQNTQANQQSKDSILQLEQLLKTALKRPYIKRGDILFIDIFNANIRISINGETVFTQHNQNLSDYLLNIWAGQPPADMTFYKQLIQTPQGSMRYRDLTLKLTLSNPNFNEETFHFINQKQTASIADTIKKVPSGVVINKPRKKPTAVTKQKLKPKPAPKVQTTQISPKSIPKAAIPTVEKTVKEPIQKTASASKPSNKTAIKEAPKKSKPKPAKLKLGNTYTTAVLSTHTAKVVADKGYSQHIQTLLIKAIKKSPLPIDIANMPAAMLYISNQGMIYSGEFAVSPKGSVKITKKERMVLKRSAISISPVPITQTMKKMKGLYVLKVTLQP